jgi:trk system potassium uptake protein TrkA
MVAFLQSFDSMAWGYSEYFGSRDYFMRIVIVGAGEVGYHVAKSLSTEGHDITVIEEDEERALKVDNELDVITIRGNGSRPSVLEEAGVVAGCSVDILVACTNRDEVNIMACWIAKRAGVKRVISRARGLEYTDSPTWARDLGIDVMSSPERSVSRQIIELLTVSSAVETAELLEGVAGIYAFPIALKSPLAGASLKQLRVRYPHVTAIIVYVKRNGKGFVPYGDNILQEGDLCFTVTRKDQVWKLEEVFTGKKSTPLRRVFIIGGGKLGFQVAHRLESQYRNVDIHLVDHNKEKCERIATELQRTLVLCGDGADETLLRQEGIEEADGLVTATESDEANILLGVVGKALGAKKTIAVVRKQMYMRLDNYISVDSMVNPNQALASVIMSYVRYPSGAGTLSLLDKVDAEMLEAHLPAGSSLSGLSLAEMNLPKGMLFALVRRGKEVFVPIGDTILHEGDLVTIFASSEMMPLAVEKLGVK